MRNKADPEINIWGSPAFMLAMLAVSWIFCFKDVSIKLEESDFIYLSGKNVV